MTEHGRHRREEPVRRGTSVPIVAVVILLVLCVAVAAVTVVLYQRVQDRQARADAYKSAAPALAAAKTSVTEILSYDYRTLDHDIATAKGDATGTFLDEYSSNAPRLLETAKQVKAVVQASVASVSVVSSSKNRVVVLTFVDQAAIRAGDKQTRIDQNRVRLTMQKVRGRWLVAGLDAL